MMDLRNPKYLGGGGVFMDGGLALFLRNLKGSCTLKYWYKPDRYSWLFSCCILGV